MKEEYKMCEGCPACEPQDYRIEVGLDLLMLCRQAMINLENHAPGYSAPGWRLMVDKSITELLGKYNLKEEQLDIFHDKLKPPLNIQPND
jgi:hypothetical protein